MHLLLSSIIALFFTSTFVFAQNTVENTRVSIQRIDLKKYIPIDNKDDVEFAYDIHGEVNLITTRDGKSDDNRFDIKTNPQQGVISKQKSKDLAPQNIFTLQFPGSYSLERADRFRGDLDFTEGFNQKKPYQATIQVNIQSAKITDYKTLKAIYYRIKKQKGVLSFVQTQKLVAEQLKSLSPTRIIQNQELKLELSDIDQRCKPQNLIAPTNKNELIQSSFAFMEENDDLSVKWSCEISHPISASVDVTIE